MDHPARVRRLRAALEPHAEAILLTDLLSIRYLTGFTGSSAQVLLTAGSLVFVTDGRYRDQAADQLRDAAVDAVVEITREPTDVTAPAAAGHDRLALEAEHVSWAAQRRYADGPFAGVELVATEGLVAALRRAKDAGEIARLESAARIADEALAAVEPRLFDRVSERRFSHELEAEMRSLGAAGPSFETIVASGPNGAMPHARPSPRVIEPGDLVVIDFGALVDGYHSDMTRTVMVGDPSPTQERMLDVVADAQAAGVAAVRAGRAAAEVDAACRDVITDAGWGDAFLHGTGHGIGLQIHEDPRVGATSDHVLAAGDCVTVEPGVYLPDHGGVRIEDSVVVTSDGCRVITNSPKR